MKNKNLIELFILCLLAILITPCLAHAGLETSLVAIKSKLTIVILPLLSVIGIALAGTSFFTGNPNAKQHIAYAVIGSIIGFGAQGIVDFISQTVR
ncbi:MAG: TrbC/VirB2 family protein [Bacteriovoracaceae bacterium]|nr:TrbC/VirB2 family protein [Bacteriovoracaceae bacterium]